MGNTCSEVITSVLVLPIMAGNYRRRQNGSRYYDGTLSSVVFFIIFLAVVIILTFSKDIDRGKDKRLAIVFILITVIMMFGMLACVTVGCFIKIYGLEQVVLRRRETYATKLQLIFLWIFGIGSGSLSAFLAGQQFQCDVLSQNIDGGSDDFWYARGTFNVIMTTFLFVELIFISYFVQFQMKCSTTVRYSLFFLVGANLSVWLHSIITDSELFIGNIPDKHFVNQSKILACLQNETFGLLLKITKPISDPCLLEFCLLSTTMLFEMWSPITPQTSSPQNSQGGEYQTIQDNVESNDILNETERNLLLGNANQTHANSLSTYGVSRTVYHLVVLVLSIAVTLGNVIYYAVWVMNPHSDQIRLVVEYYGLVEYATTIGAILVGFYCLVHYCTPDREPKPMTVSEYVFLSSAFAMIMMAVCEILTGCLSSDSSSKSTIISHVFGIVQVYLQVVFLLYANRCRKFNPSLNIHVLDCVLIFLTVININYWIIDSFVLTSFPGIRNIEKDVLSGTLWELYHRILLPAGVFFRFSSVLEMFATFQMYSTNRDESGHGV